jgi:hypothetical protein
MRATTCDRSECPTHVSEKADFVIVSQPRNNQRDAARSTARRRNMTGNFVTKDTEFKEVNTTIRHYSNMRFLAMPLFFTINGAIFYAFQNEKLRNISYAYWIAAIFSVALFAFFASFEWRLHFYLERFVEHVRKLKPDCFWSKRPGRRYLTTVLVTILYGAVVLCWFWLAYSLSSATPSWLNCS